MHKLLSRIGRTVPSACICQSALSVAKNMQKQKKGHLVPSSYTHNEVVPPRSRNVAGAVACELESAPNVFYVRCYIYRELIHRKQCTIEKDKARQYHRKYEEPCGVVCHARPKGVRYSCPRLVRATVTIAPSFAESPPAAKCQQEKDGLTTPHNGIRLLRVVAVSRDPFLRRALGLHRGS